MTFEKIQDSLQGLRNIVGADALYEENQKQRREIARLEKKIVDDEAAHKRLVEAKEREISTLQKELTEENRLTIKYDKKSYTPKTFDALINQRFNENVRQLIIERASEMYNKNRTRLMSTEVTKYPDDCSEDTRKIIEARVSKETDRILYNAKEWPPRFKKYVSDQVRIRANELKNQEYLYEVEAETNRKLETLKRGQWRLYLEEFRRNILTPYLRESFREQLSSIVEPFEAPCPKCGKINTFILSPDNVAALIKGKPVWFECDYCRGFFRQTAFKLSLGDILWYLKKGPRDTPQNF